MVLQFFGLKNKMSKHRRSPFYFFPFTYWLKFFIEQSKFRVVQNLEDELLDINIEFQSSRNSHSSLAVSVNGVVAHIQKADNLLFIVLDAIW